MLKISFNVLLVVVAAESDDSSGRPGLRPGLLEALQHPSPVQVLLPAEGRCEDERLTPSGKKRHPMAFLAWHGGKRICFGKTFAELTLKFIAAMMADKFDFKFEAASANRYSKTHLPELMFGQSHYPKLRVQLTERK